MPLVSVKPELFCTAARNEPGGMIMPEQKPTRVVCDAAATSGKIATGAKVGVTDAGVPEDSCPSPYVDPSSSKAQSQSAKLAPATMVLDAIAQRSDTSMNWSSAV